MKHTKSTATYIEWINTVINRQGYCRAVDLSREIGITPWSTSTGLKVLLKKGMIEFDSNKIISLTNEAKKDIERFTCNRDYLTDLFLNNTNDFVPEEIYELINKQVEEIYFLMNEDFMKAL